MGLEPDPPGEKPAQSVPQAPKQKKDPKGALSRDQIRTMIQLANLRIKKADAAKKERENREKDGLVVPLSQVQRFWAGQVRIVQSKLHAFPGLVIPELLTCEDYGAMYSVLEQAIHSVQVGLATEMPT